MIDEQLEFAISQYADGALPRGQRDALEAQLAADPALAQLLDEYRQLGDALRLAPPVPAIDFDRLSSHLSGVIAESEGDAAVPVYQMPWVRWAAGIAVAASLAIAVIGVDVNHRGGNNAIAPVAPAELTVAGPTAEAPSGAVVSQISVGPSPAVAMDDSTWRYSDSGVVDQQQRVVIASSDAPVQDSAQDSTATPY